ncbi:ATP-binding protein [Aliidiomarina sp.]|uniref:ATP-binding protein n=1 Tax=Aliidiomarina sp. TaxID=1872439 RepID=UPI003A4D8C3B
MIKERLLSESPSRTIMFGGLLLAVLVNFFPAPFIYSNQIFFGNAIAITLAILYGPRFALIASVAASTVTYVYWQHAIGFLPFALEVLVVVFALHIKRSMLIIGLLFWLTLGPAVVYGLYLLFSDFSSTAIETITLKYILNGILNILLGYVLFHIIRVLKLEKSVLFRISTSQLLLNSGFFIALSISTLIIYFWLFTVNKELYSQLETRAVNFSNVIQQTTAHHLDKHALAINTLATTVTEVGSTDKLNELLRNSGTLHPAFITMLASDKNGELLATWPSDMLAIARESGITNLSDRDYFKQAKASGTLYLSNAFKGQGFGNDPIVAISAPYYINNTFAGVIEGSLNLTELHGFLLSGAQHYASYLITDAAGTIVYASKELMLQPLETLPNGPVVKDMSSSPQLIFHAPSKTEYITYATTLPANGWRAISFIPVVEYEQKLSSYLFGSFLLLLILSIVCGVITFLVAKVLTNPILALIESINEAKRTGNIIPTEKHKLGYLEELNALTSGYHQFTTTLNKTMRSLQLSTLLNEDLNERLQEINESLEKRVHERTEQLQLALESVQAANTMKSSFMANMSHEIRTPLHGILGMTEVLLHQSQSIEVQQQLEVIQQSGEHLQAILNDILDFAKIEAGKLSIEKSPIQVMPFIEQLVASYQGIATRKELLLTRNIAASVPSMVMLDAVRVRQILSNILSNALKFTDTGEVSIAVNYKNEKLIVAITDTGIGIAEDDLQRIFQPFQQLDSSGARKYEGTGLGLAISMQLATLMEAKLECTSTVGEGTTFQLSINAEAL